MNVLKTSLGSCILLLLASDATLANNDKGLPQLEQIKIHLAKAGGGWIEISSLVYRLSDASAENEFDASDYDFLAEYGVKNRKTSVTRIDKNKARVVTRGEMTDVLQFVRILDSGSPFALRQDTSFDISWSGKVFKLQMRIGDDDVATTARQADVLPVLELTTDGRFTENSMGRLSENGTKLIISPQHELRIEIEELGAPAITRQR
jgi:hypothetical protein